MSDTPDSVVRTYVQTSRTAFLDNPAGRPGIPSVTVPAVSAEWRSVDPDAPAVLVHGHHHVGPAAHEDARRTHPFEPVVRDGRTAARGAADDKGRVFFPTLGARASFSPPGEVHHGPVARSQRAGNRVTSHDGAADDRRHTAHASAGRHAERVATDVVIVSDTRVCDTRVCDTGMRSEDTPAVRTGRRGLRTGRRALADRGPDLALRRVETSAHLWDGPVDAPR